MKTLFALGFATIISVVGSTAATAAEKFQAPIAVAQERAWPRETQEMLPAVGLSAAQVRVIWERLSRKAGVQLKEENFARLREALSREADVEQLGLLPRWVDRREIPQIVRQMWQVAAKGGNTEQMLDVANAAVQRSMMDASRRFGTELALLEEKVGTEIKLGHLSPDDERAIGAFVQSNASPALKTSSLMTWISGFSFDLGANVKCAKGTKKKNFKYRTLRACGGYIYGAIGVYILGIPVSAGYVGIGEAAVQLRGICGCIPEQANSLNVNHAWGTSTGSKTVFNATWVAEGKTHFFTTVPSYKAFCANSVEYDGTANLSIGSVCSYL